MKSKQISWLLLILLFLGGGWLYWEWKAKWPWNKPNKTVNTIKRQKLSTTDQIHFFFRMKKKIWIKTTHQNFFKAQSLIKKEEKKEWKIRDYLNFYWPKWEQSFIISYQTLEKRPEARNWISYQPKIALQIWKSRETVTAKELAILNLTPQTLAISQLAWTKIIKAINNPLQSQEAVKQTIAYYCSSPKKALLIAKLAANLWNW